MTQDSRAQFEAWFSEVPLLRSGDGYKFMSAHTAWNVWQASRASLLNELQSEEMVEVVALNMINCKRTVRLSLEELRKLGGYHDILIDATAALQAISKRLGE